MSDSPKLTKQIKLTDTAFIVETDERKTEAYLTCVRPKDWRPDPERINALLADLGSKKFMITDAAALRAALPSVARGNPFLFAQGIKPIDPKQGRIECAFESKLAEKIWLAEDGSVDFRRSRDTNNVKAGDLLATVIPPEPGVAGQDVFGVIIKAQTGREVRIICGKNVRLSPDGKTAYAETDGYAKRVQSKIAVDQRKVVEGNVDFHTGHVDYNGDVLIMGDVNESFQVTALGSISVMGSVDRANLKAGGDITVAGGIYGKEGIEVVAEGDICVGFAENAIIRTGGSIYVRNFLSNCTAQAGDKIHLKAVGKSLIGGRIRAAHGVVANSLGNPRIPTPTVVEFGTTPEMAQMVRSLTMELPRAEPVRRLEIANQLSEIREEYDEQLRARVVARHITYPGVKIVMEKAVFDVKNEINRTIFYKPREKNEIATRAFSDKEKEND